MDFNIIKVENDADLIRFIKSQWLFYKKDRNFVPPLLSDRKTLFDKNKNPLYQHADYQLFLAEQNGEIIGRIAAIENKRHNMIHNDKVGFFGFFECINDQSVANALFDECEKWLKNRGLNIMRGPTNPTFNDEIGMLLKGFDTPPVILMPYNPQYYLDLCENYGLKKAKDLYAYLLNYENFRSEKLMRMVGFIKERYKANVRMVDFKNKKQLKKDIQTLKEIYNAAWEPNWGFVKMTDAEFDHLAKDLIKVGNPETTLIIETNGEPAGFALGLVDINQALIHNKSGAMLTAGFHLLTKKKKIDLVRIIVLGVKPEYQKTGLDAVLYYAIGENAQKLGISKGEASWILEDNEMMNKGLTQTMQGERYKEYRIYEKPIIK